MKKYVAFEAFTGRGSTYEKGCVFSDRARAEDYAARLLPGARVHRHEVETVSELMDILEDDLTDEEAAPYLQEIL
jgi:hypothetical protein